MSKVVCLDVETTGLIENVSLPLEKQPRIIELCCVDVQDILHPKEWIINPQEKLKSIITKITGITDEDLIGKPTFEQVGKDIFDYLSSCDCIIAHNAYFDTNVLRFEFARIGLEFVPKRTICTVEATRNINGYNMRLGDLYFHLFGENFKNAHTAQADTVALAEVVLKLKELNFLPLDLF